MDIPIIEPIKSYAKTFETIDEFNVFYNKNKSDIDSRTTQMLNKLYFIKGYRITKIDGKLSLKKYDDTMKRYFSKKDEEKTIAKEISRLEQEISVIRDSVNKIIKYLTPKNGDED